MAQMGKKRNSIVRNLLNYCTKVLKSVFASCSALEVLAVSSRISTQYSLGPLTEVRRSPESLYRFDSTSHKLMQRI